MASYSLKCFRGSEVLLRDYPGSHWRAAMATAIRKDQWDKVETLNGNKWLTREQLEAEMHPKTEQSLFHTLGSQIEEQVKLRERAEARLNEPKSAAKITANNTHTEATEHPQMDGRTSQGKNLKRQELRVGLRKIAYFLPEEFKRSHLEQAFRERLGLSFTESNMANFIDECTREKVFTRVRMGLFALRPGFAQEPPPELLQKSVAAVPAAPPPQNASMGHTFPTMSLMAPLGRNPLDDLFHTKPKKDATAQPTLGWPQKPEQAAPTPVLEGTAPAAPVLAAPPVIMPENLLALISLGPKLDIDTSGDEELIIEATLLIEKLAAMVQKYDQRHSAHKQALKIVGKTAPETAAAQTPPSDDKPVGATN